MSLEKEELLIVPGEPSSISMNGEWQGDFTNYLRNWHVGSGIKREPQYAAIYAKGQNAIWVVAEMDLKKSKLKDGVISMKNPVWVNIPIRFGKNKLEGIKYSTFGKLVTHKTTDKL